MPLAYRPREDGWQIASGSPDTGSGLLVPVLSWWRDEFDKNGPNEYPKPRWRI